tara:strand:+ start:1160 stop:1939 length:780 start_codon:yes stop_codon:yes gene_type:complete
MGNFVTDYLSDPTGTKGYRKGMEQKAAAENKLQAEARGRTAALGQTLEDSGRELGGQYDFLANQSQGAVANQQGLAGAPVPTYGGAGYKKTIQDFLSPAVDYQVQQATNAIQGGAAASGSLLSGAAQKEIADRAQQIGQQEYGAAFDRMNTDRNYMTDEERQMYDSQMNSNQLGYNRASDMTQLALGGLSNRTNLIDKGVQGNVNAQLPNAGQVGVTAAGAGNIYAGQQRGAFTGKLMDLAGSAAKFAITGKPPIPGAI